MSVFSLFKKQVEAAKSKKQKIEMKRRTQTC